MTASQKIFYSESELTENECAELPVEVSFKLKITAFLNIFFPPAVGSIWHVQYEKFAQSTGIYAQVFSCQREFKLEANLLMAANIIGFNELFAKEISDKVIRQNFDFVLNATTNNSTLTKISKMIEEVEKFLNQPLTINPRQVPTSSGFLQMFHAAQSGENFKQLIIKNAKDAKNRRDEAAHILKEEHYIPTHLHSIVLDFLFFPLPNKQVSSSTLVVGSKSNPVCKSL